MSLPRALSLALTVVAGCVAHDVEPLAAEAPGSSDATDEVEPVAFTVAAEDEGESFGVASCADLCWVNPEYMALIERQLPDDLCGIAQAPPSEAGDTRWFFEDDAANALRRGTFTAIIDGGRYHFHADPPAREVEVERCLQHCRPHETRVRFVQKGCAYKRVRASPRLGRD